jgi:hypothetical protein
MPEIPHSGASPFKTISSPRPPIYESSYETNPRLAHFTRRLRAFSSPDIGFNDVEFSQTQRVRCIPSALRMCPADTPLLSYNNPDATLLGIARELRLEIYRYTLQDSLLHIHHYPELKLSDGTVTPARFTWTPCLHPKLGRGMMCKNPSWSRFGGQRDRCSHTPALPPKHTNTVALMWVCKILHSEINNIVLGYATLSIEIQNIPRVVKQLNIIGVWNVTRVSLSGRLCLTDGTMIKGLVGHSHSLVKEADLHKLVRMKDMELLGYTNGRPYKAFQLKELLSYFPHIKEISFQTLYAVDTILNAFRANDMNDFWIHTALHPRVVAVESYLIDTSRVGEIHTLYTRQKTTNGVREYRKTKYLEYTITSTRSLHPMRR